MSRSPFLFTPETIKAKPEWLRRQLAQEPSEVPGAPGATSVSPEPQKPATAVEQGKVRLVAFDLPYPPSINTYWRSLVINGRVRVLISSKGRKFKKQAADIAWRHIKTPMDGPVAVVLMVYRPRRIGDLDNVIKATLDGLKGVVFHDDNQVVRITAERHDDKAFPRIGVRVMIHP